MCKKDRTCAQNSLPLRVHELPTAGGGETKDYAADAGKRALKHTLADFGIAASVEKTQYFGFYRVKYELLSRPLVSIIIPNKDEVESLDKCLGAIKKTAYTNYEVIIVENNSEKEETFSYYKKNRIGSGTCCLLSGQV